MKVAALRGWPAVRCMRMKKILRVACRIKHLPVGIMAPSTNRRTPRHLAGEVGLARGKVAPTIPDDLRGGYHLLDFGLAAARALAAVRVHRPPTAREQNAARIANCALPTKA